MCLIYLSEFKQKLNLVEKIIIGISNINFNISFHLESSDSMRTDGQTNRQQRNRPI